MKPARAKAEAERRAKIELRKFARMVSDNAKLTNIILKLDRPTGSALYRKMRPYLRFEPIALEAINGLRS